MFRFERWIPAKWMELHRTYLRASELGIERDAAVLGSAGPNATQWTVEQEYLYVLLVHQLNTGNMSPPQLDWAMSQLRAWSRRLQMDAVPRSPEGFFVDIAGKTGLGRRTGNDSGSMLRYLDTTPLAESLERAIAALRQAETTDQGPAGADQPAADRDPGKSQPVDFAQSQCGTAARSAHRVRGCRQGAHRACRASARS